MPDNIERTIYKLEIDDSGYIRGVESMSASTSKLIEVQNQANKKLQENEAVLKSLADIVKKNQKALDDFSGADTKASKILEDNLKSSQIQYQKQAEFVANVRKEYDAATKSALDFANASGRATNLQQQTTGGKIPVPSPITSKILPELSKSLFDISDLGDLPDIVKKTIPEFETLRKVIADADAELNKMDKDSAEFKQLSPVIEQAKEVLKQYDAAAKHAGESSLSLRTQITKGREELVRLEEAGKGTSAEYITLEKNVAKLTNAFEDQRNRIKVLASETRLLDFGKAAIQSAISGFQVYTSVAVLAGGASEELQKKTLQLFAAMQLLTSLDQLAAQVKRGGTIATNLASAAQAVYTAVVGASTGALRVFRIALLSTGIGAAAVLIGFLVKKYIDYKNAVNEAAENQKLLNEVVAEGNKEAGKQIADLKILTQAARDVNLPLKERLEAVQALQKEFPDYFGNLSQETILTGDITKATDELTKSIEAAARARAAKGKIDAIEAQRLDIQFQKQKIQNATAAESARVKKGEMFITTGGGVSGTTSGVAVEGASVEQQKAVIEQRRLNALADQDDKDKALQRQEDFLVKFVGLSTIAKTIEKTDEKKKTDAAKKELQNEFDRKKAELDKRLEDLTKKEADDEIKIKIAFEQAFIRESKEIDKLVATPQQKIVLKTELGKINTLELEKALETFHKKVTDARQKLNDELKDLENKNLQDQTNLIQDEFDRRAKLIELNEQKELKDAEVNTTKRLDALDFQRLLIGEQAYQDAKARIISAGELQALNILQRFANERQDLAADTFDTFFTFIDDEISRIDLVKDQQIAKGVQEAKTKFLAGEIQFAEFEKRIAALKKEAENKARADTLFIQQAELSDLQTQMDSIEDKTTKHYKSLVKKAEQLKKDIAAAQSNTSDVEDPNRRQVETVQQYAEAIGAVTASVIAFWQKANEAETQALDRSIALQEKRVEAAQRIAERGNAQYLKQEQDRLTQLNVQRENAARKQLGIDAALQASQLLVGITGAISKIASGIGAAETIAEIAIIVGALATGYGLVKSLQGNQPKLKTGTTYLKRDGHPSGTDTIPVMANEGEAWIPTETNRQYHPTVKAIYNKTIPAETLNEFVENYTTNKITKNIFNKDIKEVVNTSHVEKIVNNVVTKHLNDFITIHKIKEVPQVDYNRIKDAAELKITSDGKLAVSLNEQNKLIIENNDLQRQTLRAMKSMSISANIDRDGVAIMVNEWVQQKKIDSKI